MATTDLVINLLAKDDASSKVNGLSKNISGLSSASSFASSAIRSMGLALTSYLSVRTLSMMVNEFAKSETALIAMESALRSNGESVQEYSKQLQDMAKELQNTSAYEDDNIIRMQALLLSYGKTADEVKKLTPFLVDLASKMSLNSGETVSLQQAYTAYTSALNGMERPLRSYGINLNDVTLKSKDAAAITKELGDRINGATEQLGDTTIGKIERYKNAWGSFFEVLGSKIANSKWFNDFIYGLESLGIMLSKQTPDSSGYVKQLKDIASAMPSLNDETTKYIDNIKSLNENTAPGLLEKLTKGLFSITTTENIASNSDGIADLRYQLSQLYAELVKYSNVQIVVTENTKIVTEETDKLITTIEALADKQQIIADTESELGINTQAWASDMGTAAEALYNGFIPLEETSGILLNNLMSVFGGDISLGEALKNAGKELLMMLARIALEATIVKFLINAIFNPLGSLFGGATKAVSAGGAAGFTGLPTIPIPMLSLMQEPIQPINYFAPISLSSQHEVVKDVMKIINKENKINARYTK